MLLRALRTFAAPARQLVGPVLLWAAAVSAAEPPAPLRLASLEWAPYVGAELPQHGYAAEVVRSACARRGVDVQIDFLPWARALMLALRGDYAGLMPEYHDPTREAGFVYSAPFPGGPVGLFRRRGDPIRYATPPDTDIDAALRSIAGYRIGVVRGYVNNAAFDTATYLHREEAVSDRVNLRKLAHGRVDLVFIDRWVAEHLQRDDPHLRAARLEMLEPAIEVKSLYVAWSRRSPQAENARLACDEGLHELAADGSLARIRAAHGLEPAAHNTTAAP